MTEPITVDNPPKPAPVARPAGTSIPPLSALPKPADKPAEPAKVAPPKPAPAAVPGAAPPESSWLALLTALATKKQLAIGASAICSLAAGIVAVKLLSPGHEPEPTAAVKPLEPASKSSAPLQPLKPAEPPRSGGPSVELLAPAGVPVSPVAPVAPVASAGGTQRSAPGAYPEPSMPLPPGMGNSGGSHTGSGPAAPATPLVPSAGGGGLGSPAPGTWGDPGTGGHTGSGSWGNSGNRTNRDPLPPPSLEAPVGPIMPAGGPPQGPTMPTPPGGPGGPTLPVPPAGGPSVPAVPAGPTVPGAGPALPALPAPDLTMPLPAVPGKPADTGPKLPAVPDTGPKSPVLPTPGGASAPLPEPGLLIPSPAPRGPTAPHTGSPTGGSHQHSPTVPLVGGERPGVSPTVPLVGGGTSGTGPVAPPAQPDFGPMVPAGPAAAPRITPVGGGQGPVAPAFGATPAAPTGPAGGTTMEFTKPPGSPPAPVPEKTPTTSYDVDIYHPKAGDTYESISREFYNDTRYAAALQAYNRELGKDGKRPSQATVDVPPLHIVKRYAPGTPADATPAWGTAGGSVRTTGARTYTVPQGGMSLATIAKSLLGSEQRWRDIYDLNPQVTNPSQVPAGTELKLPTDARNPG